MASYDEEFKKRLVRMHLEEGRTIKSLSEEYQVSENGIGYWLKKYREECSKNPAAQEEYDLMKENLRLRKELEEAKKENEFTSLQSLQSVMPHSFSLEQPFISSTRLLYCFTFSLHTIFQTSTHNFIVIQRSQ